MILAIDPGPTQSAWVMYDADEPKRRFPIVASGIEPNDELLERLGQLDHVSRMAIEMVACYGMAVGVEVFETVWWIGRFCEAWRCYGGTFERVYRMDVKMHLCHDSRAKDANIRQALIDLLGPQGTKKAPGPTYGIKGDMWSALAVAVTAEAGTCTEGGRVTCTIR